MLVYIWRMDVDSTVYLHLGKLALDCRSPNRVQLDYSELFQPSDKYEERYPRKDNSWKTVTEVDDAYRRSLRTVVARLDLLGYSLAQMRAMYEHARLHPPAFPDPYYEPPPLQPFDELAESIGQSDVESPSSVGGHLDPFTRLQLLAENPANLDLSVTWHPSNERMYGFLSPEGIKVGAKPWSQVLIVTEGRSDVEIIQRALELLKPEVEDFFRFIDMERDYPFTNVNELHKLFQGLLKIGVLNDILFIFDNDTAGTTKFALASRLNAPPNIRAMTLPDMKSFETFATIGPTGEQTANINGKAVAIECFLDLEWQTDQQPRIRWTSYDDKRGQYQGAFDEKDKDAYQHRFSALKRDELAAYDTAKLEVLLDSILTKCKEIAAARIEQQPSAAFQESWYADRDGSTQSY